MTTSVLARHSMLLALVVALAAPPAVRAQEPAQSNATVTSALTTVFPVAVGTAVAMGQGRGMGQTVVSGVLMWGGAIVGPTVGYLAAGHGRPARNGVLFRAAVFAAAWAIAPTDDFDDGFVPNPELDDVGVWLAAVPAIAISATYDIVKADRRVRAASRRVGVLPLRTRDGVGLAISISH